MSPHGHQLIDSSPTEAAVTNATDDSCNTQVCTQLPNSKTQTRAQPSSTQIPDQNTHQTKQLLQPNIPSSSSLQPETSPANPQPVEQPPPNHHPMNTRRKNNITKPKTKFSLSVSHHPYIPPEPREPGPQR